MSLELDQVTVAVPDGEQTRTILDRVSLHVEPGEVVAITGPSGSGKSTLLAVAGLLREPDSGDVSIGGRIVPARPRATRTAIRSSSIGLVFQSSNLFPSLTALEQVELVAHIAGRLDGAARRRARDLPAAVGLERRTGQRPAQLSGGERQRVGIARALMNEPLVLLADEPTASLDPERGREVMALLVAEANRREIATVIITHDHQQLAGHHRHLDLDRGRLLERTAASSV